MAVYQSIPQNGEGNTFSPTSWSSISKKITAAAIAITTVTSVSILFTKRESIGLTVSNTSTYYLNGNSWPNLVNSGILSALNDYKGNGKLGMNNAFAPGRPTTTTEATENDWKKIDEKCVKHLGYPWAFDGEVTKGAPVTLYFSKESELVEGKLTGIAVHYFDGVAPAKMIERSIFSKGIDYDTIQVAFRDEDTDVCGGGPLPDNDPLIDVILAADKGRISIPMTEDAAGLSGQWAQGACIRDMGTHWEHDIVGGSNLTFEAENLFPIVPMYDEGDGSFNAIFFQAPARMQNWDLDYCGYPPFAPNTMECATKTNMWDGGPGLREETTTSLNMCANFCGPCELTGAAGDPAYYTTMHWWFVETEDISPCTTSKGPICTPLDNTHPTVKTQ